MKGIKKKELLIRLLNDAKDFIDEYLEDLPITLGFFLIILTSIYNW